MNEMVKTLYTDYTNGTLYCLLSRRIIPVDGVNPNEVFDLSDPKFVLLASGLIEEECMIILPQFIINERYFRCKST